MEKKETKRVEIAAIDDKCQITAGFGCSISGNFYWYNLFIKEKQRCLPKGVPFPADWHVTCTQNHMLNEKTMEDYIKK